MIRLPYTGSYALELVTAQNGAQVFVSYSDATSSTYVGNSVANSITSATTTTICAAPTDAAIVKDVDEINIKNTYAGSHTITVQIRANAIAYPLVTAALLADESLNYTHGSGWQCKDANGNTKNTPLTAMTSAQLASIITDETGTGALVFADNATMSGLIVGNPGVEGSGINISGTTFNSQFKVSDIDGANFAQTILHRHSTTLEPLILGARSNSNTSAHADVTAGMNLFTNYVAGYAGANYKLFGALSCSASSSGSISNTSAPGAWTFYTTPNAATFPITALLIDQDQSVKATSPTGGLGYATGAGGTVTQLTSKATGVTLNKVTGSITMNNAALGAGTIVSFTLTDSAIAATDLVVVQHISAGTVGAYTCTATAAAGSATVYVRNNTGGSLSEAIVLRFAIIRSADA